MEVRMDERRSVARWQINKEVELILNEGVNVTPCIVEDISTKGMRVSLNKNLFPEVFSNFNIALADKLTFHAGAHVAWCDNTCEKNIYGLMFNRIEEPAKERICQYVQDNFPNEMTKHLWRGI